MAGVVRDGPSPLQKGLGLGDLIEQRGDLGGVIDAAVGRRGGNDPVAATLHAPTSMPMCRAADVQGRCAGRLPIHPAEPSDAGEVDAVYAGLRSSSFVAQPWLALSLQAASPRCSASALLLRPVGLDTELVVEFLQVADTDLGRKILFVKFQHLLDLLLVGVQKEPLIRWRPG